jgi:hypothetical protein
MEEELSLMSGPWERWEYKNQVEKELALSVLTQEPQLGCQDKIIGT